MRNDGKNDVRRKFIENYWLKKITSIGDSVVSAGTAGQGGNNFESMDFEIEPSIIRRVRDIAKNNEKAEYLIFLSFFGILLYKYYKEPVLTVSLPGIKPLQPEHDGEILLFYKLTISATDSLKQVVQHVREEWQQVVNHKDCNYNRLQRLFRAKEIDEQPLYRFGVYDCRINVPSSLFEKVGLQLKPVGITGGKPHLRVTFDPALYDGLFIRQLASHYFNLLGSLPGGLDIPVEEVRILSEQEKHRLLFEFNDTTAGFPAGKTLVDLFEQQVTRTPYGVVVQYEDRLLTYSQLDKNADGLAHYLGKAYGICPGDIAAMVQERSEWMITAVLGILKAGAAYLPLSPNLPEERINAVLKDSNARALVTADFPDIPLPPAPATCPPGLTHQSPAYIIYTSGSTGIPKGVIVEHRSVVRLLVNDKFQFEFDQQDVWTLFHSIWFDFSVWEMWGALLYGGRLVVVPEKIIQTPAAFLKLLENEQVTVLNQIPTLFTNLSAEVLKSEEKKPLSLRYIIFGGDALNPGLLKQWYEQYPQVKLVNMYGITETTVHVTFKEIGRKEMKAGKSNIGLPIPTLSCYIMGPGLRLEPVGIVGEIVVGGEGVGRGYLNRQELTDEKFTANPYIKGERVYCSGDLGKRLPGGDIEYLGRRDNQVKIRGYRIECGEIESKLAAIGGVNEVKVIAREDKDGDKYLAAYFTAGCEVSSSECRQHLACLLPDYMVPAFFVQLEKFPLTSTGKVDRNALPEPDRSGSRVLDDAPRNELEKTLVRIWQEVLDLDNIGINDDFFRLGGNSIKGIHVVNRVQEWLEEIVHVTVLFQCPTIRELAARLETYKQDVFLGMDEAGLAEMRQVIRPLEPLERPLPKNPPAAFILSPPRSGTTLLRVILAGHPHLFAPPELELLGFNTLRHRKKVLTGRFGYFAEGVLRALMEIDNCSPEEAKSLVSACEEKDLTSQEFYGLMQKKLGNRLLIDKTPWYALDLEILKRAEVYFERPRYIHLLRNPYAVIHSFEEAKLDQVFRYTHSFSPRQLAELVWYVCNQNIVEFLKSVPAGRKHIVRFEELVQDPEPVVQGICDFLGVDFQREMLRVYENTEKKMTGGIYPESKMLGDIKFFQHSRIDAGVKDKWKAKYKTDFLGSLTVKLAKSLGYLKGKEEKYTDYSKLEPAPLAEHYALSHAQGRLWILEQMGENRAAYNIPEAYLLEGDIKPEVLEKLFETLVRRHESLRTTFITVGGEPRQRVRDFESLGFKLKYTDLRDSPDREGQTKYLADECASAAFDLVKGPLLRALLIRLEEHKHLLLFTMHHIISDGWSMRLFIGELLGLYGNFSFSPLRLQYKDYSEWQNSKKGQEVMEQCKTYWLREFSGDIPLLDLPTDYSRPGVRSFEGNTVHFELGETESGAIKELAQSGRVSLFMVLLALYNVFLSKMTDREDIVVGVPTAGRNHADLEKITGMFVNTLALRNYPSPRITFIEFLSRVRQQTLDAFENQAYPFEDLVEKVVVERDMSHNPLFDVMFVLQGMAGEGKNIPAETVKGLKIQPFAYEYNISKFDLTLSAVEVGEQLFFSWEYCTALFNEETMGNFIRYFKKMVLSMLENPGKEIIEIDLIPEKEKKKVLHDFNNTNVDYPEDKTIHRLFEEQAAKTPDNIALVAQAGQIPNSKSQIPNKGVPFGQVLNAFGAGQLSYRELNEKSGQLAHELVKKGVRFDTIVGIMVERSVEMIVGILGILKAGGAYLPIDPGYPKERINYMLDDSSVKILLSKENEVSKVSEKTEVINKMSVGNVTRLACSTDMVSSTLTSTCQVGPANLAYVIYTSGSTGQPKGVMVEHGSLVNLCSWHIRYYSVTSADRATQYAEPGFDASVWETFPYLVCGASVYIVHEEIKLDIQALNDYFEKNRISISFLPTQLCEIFMTIDNRGLRVLLTGGDKLKRFIKRYYQLFNNYGPTENTVVAASYLVTALSSNIPIGKPMDNNQIYILNRHNHLQPIEVPGELCIGGSSLSRGYLNQPELTAERFINYKLQIKKVHHSPFIKTPNRLYLTGDLARWLPDGNIQYLGRMDNQVKIRGYRIELPEVENRLLSHHDVEAAVVTAKENQGGEKYLCAYIVSKKELTVSIPELREYLLKTLPSFMVPSYFIPVETFPLTPTGKIHTSALPDPAGMEITSGYTAPHSEVEKSLAEIWEKVLARDNIGIDDNFFMIGGDSIKALQVAARMNKAGYRVEVRDIFRAPSVSELAPLVKKSSRLPLQSAIHGKVPLTPIQERFFTVTPVNPHHYNQSVMLYSKEGFDEQITRAVFKRIQEHHDALRMTYKKDNGEVLQMNHHLDYPFKLQVYDLRGLPGKRAAARELAARADEIHAGLDLETGPMMRLGLFHMSDGDRLLIVIHHLVVDGVSWRILFEEIETLYRGIQTHGNIEAVELPLKSDSFKVWAEQLVRYANSPGFLKEKAYWARLESTDVPAIPKDFPRGDNLLKDEEVRAFTLSAEETDRLLTKVNHAFGTEINDILLTALAAAIKETWGHDRVFIDMEGHGREEIPGDIDISRTVGWFTTLYPVLPDVSFARDLARQVKEVKECLRQVPNKGIGYGILKYLTTAGNKGEIEFRLNPQVSFNYLGQFDAEVGQMTLFQVAGEPAGAAHSKNAQRDHEIQVSGIIARQQLGISISYSKNQYKASTIETLLDHLKTSLSRLISFCAAREKKESTPSDFTFKGLAIETVDRLSSRYPSPIEDIYTLSPMQEGMLFHALYDKGSTTYFEQFSYRLNGRLNPALVEKSLNHLFKRYDILRTVFIHEGVDRPVQVVFKDPRVDFLYEDKRDFLSGDEEKKEEYIRDFLEKDRQRSFDLSRDVLMRVAVIRLEEEEYAFAWSHHHILVDGWCKDILIANFFEIYNSFRENRDYQLPGVTPYRTYIQWLENQDKEEAGKYWRKYLEGYDEAAHISSIKGPAETGGDFDLESHILSMGKEMTAHLHRLAGQNRVTLNTVIHALWGIILGRYTGKQDVVFGTVVSGRPSEIPGIESMVGLFINTVPVRIRCDGKTTFSDLLQEVHLKAAESESYHYYPLADIQALGILKQDLFDHLLVFENYPMVEQIEDALHKTDKKGRTPSFTISKAEKFKYSTSDFNIIIALGEELVFSLEYKRSVYDQSLIRKIGSHIKEVIAAVVENSETKVADITLSFDYKAAKPGSYGKEQGDFDF